MVLLFASYSIYPDAMGFWRNYWPFIIFYQLLWIQILWIMFFITWTNYYLDVILVTNKRVVDIEQLGLFSRDIAEIRLESIQDIKSEVLGFISSLFKMGNLHIQSAGQTKEILLRNMPEPEKIKDAISKCRDEVLHEKIVIHKDTTPTQIYK